jgi:NAD(P)-dependent dehydrogenase (short-subunit alcohol dehydrogenase family)
MDLFSLNDKVAIVTGALGLLGKENCLALAEAGAYVVVCDLDEKGCADFAETLTPRGLGVGVDVTDQSSVENLLERTIDRFGRINILVNNAAINEKFENPIMAAKLSQVEHYPLGVWKKLMDVNVNGVFLCSKIIGASMAEQGHGSIINIASTYGMVAPDQSIYRKPTGEQAFYKSPAYPTTKGAVLALTKHLAAYWGHKGVRVNALSPGGVENMQEEFFIQNYCERTPLGRMARPFDYRGAIIFLASDASGYMTGANLVVDGGWTAI